MPRRKLIAANWKMNKTISEADSFASEFRERLPGLPDCDVLIFPSFFCLRPLADALAGTRVALGSQDVYWEPAGAFTGEVSPAMVRDAGGSVVLAGHSERRHVIGETDAIVARKLEAAAAAGLGVILCVGETLDERERGTQEAVVVSQLERALASHSPGRMAGIVVAYEPVWAIGTGRTATLEDAAAMHGAIRTWAAGRFGRSAADDLRVQYGGSVKPSNAAEFLAHDDVDGLLVGGASLAAESFAAIIEGVPAA